MVNYLTTLTIDDFKAYFPANFPYLNSSGGEQLDSYVSQAFTIAINEINNRLFANNDILKVGYFYLTAHYLVLSMRDADIGVQSIGQQVVNMRKVKDVLEQYAIPKYLLEDALLNSYSMTNYGIRYLSMIASKLRGNVIHIPGTTRA